jgi:hypothetical protein
MMIRGLLAAASAAIIFGTAIGVAPAAGAEPLDGNCIAGKLTSDGSCYYSSCAEAKSNGECDIAQGDSHYCPKRDGDGDGIACEC